MSHTAVNAPFESIASATPGPQDERGVVPLIISVTGHRDLVDFEVPAIRQRVEALLRKLGDDFPDRPILVLSGLAEGADSLVADVALKLGIPVTAVLPMHRDIYRDDFRSEAARADFVELLSRAHAVVELPILEHSAEQDVSVSGDARNLQYAQLGVYLCSHCHVLLALWDGKPSPDVGGTAQVVRFHHYDKMAGYESAGGMSQQILADDESDLVYHIVVSRARENGAPRPDLQPLDAFWLTTSEDNPVTRTIPDKYLAVFESTSEFNREVRRHSDAIFAESYSLANTGDRATLPWTVLRVNEYFCAADWLAIRYQKLFITGLKVSQVLIFVMAVAFLLHSTITVSHYVVYSIGICLGVSVLLQQIAKRYRWHAKYLEYRTLAEGLRVQFYWAAGGATTDDVTKYGHDNFLQKQDPQLGWIRNVMRCSGLYADANPNLDKDCLSFVLEDWIGDETRSGQLNYFRIKAGQHNESSARVEMLGRVVGGLVGLMLIGSVVLPLQELRTACFLIMGLVLIIASLREAYSFRVAEKEVIKQYEFMYRIFHNARIRLQQATTDDDRRRILRVLGEAALDEHAEWILMRRDRPLGGSQIWRMEA
jgi:hypothetical protein